MTKPNEKHIKVLALVFFDIVIVIKLLNFRRHIYFNLHIEEFPEYRDEHFVKIGLFNFIKGRQSLTFIFPIMFTLPDMP